MTTAAIRFLHVSANWQIYLANIVTIYTKSTSVTDTQQYSKQKN